MEQILVQRNELGRFEKGCIPYNKDKTFPEFSRENHPNWKGGKGHIFARKVCIENGRDLTTCQICKEKAKKMCVHHCDGNINNNSNFNLAIVCDYCHHAIHHKPHQQKKWFKKNYERESKIDWDNPKERYNLYKDKQLSANKIYREKHKEEIKRQKKEEYEKNKDKIRQHQKKYREQNREKINKQKRKVYHLNKMGKTS
jgi:hypothetical protein